MTIALSTVESSAGVLMAGVGAVLEEAGEVTLAGAQEPRPRPRSGSCSDTGPPRPPHPPLKHTPTSPKPEADCFKLLTRWVLYMETKN